jgi:glycosyltransferase involved in cell wall biosynthesis
MIYNLKTPQVACADYAIRKLGIPVVLEYEDDYFSKIYGTSNSRISRLRGPSQAHGVRRLLSSVSGCLAGSAELLSQVPSGIPKLLLPGVVGDAIPNSTRGSDYQRQNWVIFSGTHSPFQGLEQLIRAWRLVNLPNWQLHIAGKGELTPKLQEIAQGDPTIVFRGVLNRKQNMEFLSLGKLTVVAYEVSTTIGFSFKTLECLGSGIHVITTPLTALETLEPELKAGLTYIPDNNPATIAASLKKVIGERIYERTVQAETLRIYGPAPVARSLEAFLNQVRMQGSGNGGR